MYSITRKLEFDSAHRVMGHEGKCKNFHGHRYTAEITVEASGLDKVGRVVDFGAIKDKVGSWVDRNWDHGTILNSDDPLYGALTDDGNKVYHMPFNPTAENMAEWLLEVASKLLEPGGLEVTRVRLYETPNCWADAYPVKTPPTFTTFQIRKP